MTQSFRRLCLGYRAVRHHPGTVFYCQSVLLLSSHNRTTRLCYAAQRMFVANVTQRFLEINVLLDVLWREIDQRPAATGRLHKRVEEAAHG